MTRFDAEPLRRDPNDSSFWSARSTIAGQFAVFAFSIFLAAIAVCVACGLLLTSRGVENQLARSIEAIQLSVFLQPQVSRADAEGLRSRLETTPTVVGAKLRTRDEAMASLVAGGSSSLSTKPNPLPDVWTVTLGRAEPEGANRSLASRVADARLTLSGLPGVDSVRVDGRWVALLDRWAPLITRGTTIAIWAVASTLTIALFCTFFLAGRAYTALATSSGKRDAGGRKQALATAGMISGLLALALAGLVLGLTGLALPDLGACVTSILDSMGRDGHIFIVCMGVAVIVVSAAATILGGSSR